jgi:transposase-like protein
VNKTKIEWCDSTLNPVVGCPFCTSDKIKANPNGLADGTRFICEGCGRKFDYPIKRAKRKDEII